MIPKEAIEKAIEGGWKLAGYEQYSQEVVFFPSEKDGDIVTKWNPYWIEVYITTAYRDNKPFKKIERVRWEQIALDPTFWQALGKALRWPEVSPGNSVMSGYFPQTWHYNALRFYDLILTGGDTTKFWNDLLTNN